MLTTVEVSTDGMFFAQRPQRSQVHGFRYVVCMREVVDLAVEKIVHLKGHLCKEPVVLVVYGSVYEISVDIGLDSQGHEVAS